MKIITKCVRTPQLDYTVPLSPPKEGSTPRLTKSCEVPNFSQQWPACPSAAAKTNIWLCKEHERQRRRPKLILIQEVNTHHPSVHADDGAFTPPPPPQLLAAPDFLAPAPLTQISHVAPPRLPPKSQRRRGICRSLFKRTNRKHTPKPKL